MVAEDANASPIANQSLVMVVRYRAHRIGRSSLDVYVKAKLLILSPEPTALSARLIRRTRHYLARTVERSSGRNS